MLHRIALALCVLLLASSASAQDRSRSERARLELAFEVGYGGSSEGGFGELGGDLRLWAPNGAGVVLRTGLATTGFSNAFGVDLGAAYRLDLLSEEHLGLQLAGAIGPSVAYGPFDEGYVAAYGGFAMIHLDFWYRNVLVGVGVSAHAMAPERHMQLEGRDDPILTLTPLIRIGGDWGL